MNCFNHAQTSAIGTCKVCCKGLCADCVVDLDHGIACKNKHEERAESINMIITQNAKVYADAPKNIYMMPAFFLFMGTLFAGKALYNGYSFSDSSVIMGLGFVFFGVLFFIRNRKMLK